MSKHTPGPWLITADEFAHIVVDQAGTEIHVGANEANARLIAAAPELLEALQDLCDTLGECGMTEKARAAIAKATGGNDE